jgi:A/G-specific adenine glycosylase
MIQSKNLEPLTKPLLMWFSQNARVLPWRSTPTPYRVWVSEIMLQQTRVEAVKPYFERFVRELPDVAALAACEEERLLKLWEGLGYYNRVRNMHLAAQTVMQQYGGELPHRYEELLTLKGIGHYTAGAIASIAYGQAVPAVDGNVFRVLTRACMDDTDIMKQSFRNYIEGELKTVIPADRAGDYNQALMELGATVCLPNGAPKCEQCPWETLCQAHLNNVVERYPHKEKKQKRRIEEKTVLVIMDGDKIVLNKRPAKGLLAGMYEFPSLPGYVGEQEALQFAKEAGLEPLHIREGEEAVHIFSHVEWRMKSYLIRVAQMEEQPKQMLLVETATAEEKYPIPSAFAAYAKYLNMKLGNNKGMQ